MANDRNNTNRIDNREDSKGLNPDPETLHTTDPQEHMEGPVSSLMHKTGESFETDQTKNEADNEKERKM